MESDRPVVLLLSEHVPPSVMVTSFDNVVAEVTVQVLKLVSKVTTGDAGTTNDGSNCTRIWAPVFIWQFAPQLLKVTVHVAVAPAACGAPEKATFETEVWGEKVALVADANPLDVAFKV